MHKWYGCGSKYRIKRQRDMVLLLELSERMHHESGLPKLDLLNLFNLLQLRNHLCRNIYLLPALRKHHDHQYVTLHRRPMRRNYPTASPQTV